MVSLEQVQLLENKVVKTIEYVQKLNEENAALLSERVGLQQKLEANQKRLDELELLVIRFKEDQGRIEDGIVAALDRLNQFEEDFEKGLNEKTTQKKTQVKKEKKAEPESDSKEYFEISEKETQENAKSAEDSIDNGVLQDSDLLDSDLDSESLDNDLDIF
jgi:predicted nuclease with TOPRIM domain